MSRLVFNGENKHVSRLVKAVEDWKNLPDSFSQKPDGVFGAVAKVICGGVTINSSELDFEFDVKFDDDLEPNEATITIYNLTDDTIKQFKTNAEISIEAGYTGDTGVIFKGFVSKVKTTRESSDKVTSISCFDDVSNKTLESVSYAAGYKASDILKDLLGKTGKTVKVFNPKRDHTYENDTTVEGDLMQNIKKYSEVCGVSTYILNGVIYCRHITEGDNAYFKVSEETGMIGSPAEYEEEVQAEDFKDVIKGYEIEMILQHRMQTAAIISLESQSAKGQYRVRSGSHSFSPDGCTTNIKVM